MTFAGRGLGDRCQTRRGLDEILQIEVQQIVLKPRHAGGSKLLRMILLYLIQRCFGQKLLQLWEVMYYCLEDSVECNYSVDPPLLKLTHGTHKTNNNIQKISQTLWDRSRKQGFSSIKPSELSSVKQKVKFICDIAPFDCQFDEDFVIMYEKRPLDPHWLGLVLGAIVLVMLGGWIIFFKIRCRVSKKQEEPRRFPETVNVRRSRDLRLQILQ